MNIQLVTAATLQMFSSDVEFMATVLDSTDTEHFHPHRKFWTLLL